jgi:hypothetical protein
LISREDALRLGELEDRTEIEALVERAWRARRERFADSSDMCSLVNAKSDDNGSHPRPDNRSGWLHGETPDVVGEALARAERPELTVRLWDPSSQLRKLRKRSVPPRPDGAPNTGRDVVA